MFLPTKSYAKVNLCLAVDRPQPAGSHRPGWHRISSWFHTVDLCDDITLEHTPHAPPTFERMAAADAPLPVVIDWPLESDLIFKAYQLLRQHVGTFLPARICLKKRIPSGGGLGGGSSNAATVLRGLNALFGLDIPTDQLQVLSRSLGSDVAYFLDDSALDAPPAPAIVSGFGELVERLPRLHQAVTLCTPPFGCPTPRVYQAFDALASGTSFRAPAPRAAASQALSSGRVDEAGLFNDLLPAAEQVEPRLARVMHLCRGAGASAHLSGSGSTIFMLGHVGHDLLPLIRTRLL